MKNKKQWENYAELYSYFIDELEDKKGNTDNVFPRIIDMIGPVQKRKVLDYGCGEGRLARILYDLGADVYAFDISKNMIKKGKEKNENRKIIYSSDINSKVIFRENFYDFIFCFMVLITIKKGDLGCTLEKIYNVLKINGKAIFVNTNPETIGYKFENFFSEIEKKSRKDGCPYKTFFRTSKGTFDIIDYYYSSIFLRELYKKSGFTVIHEETIDEQFLLHIVEKGIYKTSFDH